MSDWPIAVETLGTELERALARRRARNRRLRLLPVWLLAALAVATAAGATRGLIEQGVPVPWGGGQEPARPLPLEPLRAADPAGGPAWGLRLAVAGPAVCQAVGQVVGGRLGVIRGRVFHPLPPAYRESCARLRDDDAAVRWSQYPGPNVGSRGARTVVHGVAGSKVVTVTVSAGDVVTRLPLSPRGGFIRAFPGLRSPAQLRVRVTSSDGKTTDYSGESP